MLAGVIPIPCRFGGGILPFRIPRGLPLGSRLSFVDLDIVDVPSAHMFKVGDTLFNQTYQ